MGIIEFKSFGERAAEGIADADQERIFESYHSNRTHGVGLGLALVRQIVNAHRGRIEVDSAPSGGARFRVSFPQAKSEPPRQAESLTA